MGLAGKDLLSMRELTVDEIRLILDTAESMKEVARRDIKKVPALRGKTLINLFYEPSTRTRTSFEIAGKWLSADVVNISISSSSVAKGESLKDTGLTLQAMHPDVVVIRHPSAGAAEFLAKRLAAPIINAGDGAHEHPSQALLDLFTIREKVGRLEGLKAAIIGDITHSRVARSNIHGMQKMGMEVRVAGPRTMLPRFVERLGVEVFTNLDRAIAEVDVIMMLRLQVERQQAGLFPSLREYSRLFGLTVERLKAAKPNVLIMHPGPINRGVEIAPDVADGPYSLILNQVENGLAVRMALLYLIAGGGQAG
ncbi:aspartate carbamoyltransferase [Candidatus Methylomirabilis limnetica]|jgi:aspartate carbamoyltransferase catalytic subunit|uniref:Aspartate carbamoyltransferase n=1 Tax=Candidatus Methylomirabilis limnetica TaxID=2033718 RepID=A0A2T4TWV6_9BACT|nr:aspartate carbamoyltransferase catalytic subunit [Candidatus Methylomirabilis limnetica]PTL35593.1 aspartate carbamoyltransferase [Candidatus Methylomirabilis limnetica]